MRLWGIIFQRLTISRILKNVAKILENIQYHTCSFKYFIFSFLFVTYSIHSRSPYCVQNVSFILTSPCGPYYCIPSVQFSSVQWLSRVRLFATPWTTARQASLSITNSWSSLRLTSIESVIPSSHLICPPLGTDVSSPSPPAPNPSQHQSLFQWVNSSHEVARVLEFQL